VFLCFGDVGFFYECAFALLSIARWHSGPDYPFAIKIFTDKPGWFGRFADCDLPLEVVMLDPQQIAEWTGKAQYVYRIKPALLEWLSATVVANWLFLDTDVVVTSQLTGLFTAIDGGQVVMHQPEGTPESGTSPVLRRLNRLCHKLPGWQQYTSQPTWNSGVVGFNSTHNRTLKAALQLIDEGCTGHPSVRTLEQVALSWSFLQHTPLLPALPYVLHYWNLKEARPLLQAFFDRFEQQGWQQMVHLSANIQMYALFLDRIRFGYNRTPADLLSGKKWQPGLDNFFPKGNVK
jgi:hypothetical protein